MTESDRGNRCGWRSTCQNNERGVQLDSLHLAFADLIDVLKPLGDGILRFRDCSDWGARLDASQPLHGVEPVLEQVRKGVSDLGEFNERKSYFTYFEFVFCMGFEWFIFVPSHVSFDHLLSFINVMFYKLRIPRQSDEVKHFHNFRGAASHKLRIPRKASTVRGHRTQECNIAMSRNASKPAT